MNWMTARLTLVSAVVLAGVGSVGQAGDCGAPCAPACAPAPVCAVMTRKVMVTEYKPETYQAERTVYKTEWVDQKFTWTKCEMVPVEKSRTVTFYTLVPETKDVT